MNYLGDPLVLKKPYTRFELHQFDVHLLVEVLVGEEIPFLAFEDKVCNNTWVIHIPDGYRPQFDEISSALQIDIGSMHFELGYSDRVNESAVHGLRSKQARCALIFVATVMGVLFLISWVLGVFD